MPKINFIFERRATTHATHEFTSTKFHRYLHALNPRLRKNPQLYSTLIHNSHCCDRDISTQFVDDFRECNDLDFNNINVFVLPWSLPYLTEESTKLRVQHLHKLQDERKNVVILADYSHESMVPGSIGYRFLSNNSWAEPERYVLMILSLKNQNMDPRLNFKEVVPTWNYVTATLIETIEKTPEDFTEIYTYEHQEPEFTYIVPNRIGRKHRLNFMCKMHERGLLSLDRAEWSMAYPDHPTYNNKKYLEYFGNTPKCMSRPWHHWSSPDGGAGGPDQRLPTSLAQSGYVYIANETFMDLTDDSEGSITNFAIDPNEEVVVLDVSEKILKGFLYGLPMFINARRGAVEYLRSLGFWLPGGNYNDEHDVSLRMDRLLDESEKFVKKCPQPTPAMIRKLLRNQQLILDLGLHYHLAEPMFSAIETHAKTS